MLLLLALAYGGMRGPLPRGQFDPLDDGEAPPQVSLDEAEANLRTNVKAVSDTADSVATIQARTARELNKMEQDDYFAVPKAVWVDPGSEIPQTAAYRQQQAQQRLAQKRSQKKAASAAPSSLLEDPPDAAAEPESAMLEARAQADDALQAKRDEQMTEFLDLSKKQDQEVEAEDRQLHARQAQLKAQAKGDSAELERDLQGLKHLEQHQAKTGDRSDLKEPATFAADETQAKARVAADEKAAEPVGSFKKVATKLDAMEAKRKADTAKREHLSPSSFAQIANDKVEANLKALEEKFKNHQVTYTAARAAMPDVKLLSSLLQTAEKSSGASSDAGFAQVEAKLTGLQAQVKADLARFKGAHSSDSLVAPSSLLEEKVAEVEHMARTTFASAAAAVLARAHSLTKLETMQTDFKANEQLEAAKADPTRLLQALQQPATPEQGTPGSDGLAKVGAKIKALKAKVAADAAQFERTGGLPGRPPSSFVELRSKSEEDARLAEVHAKLEALQGKIKAAARRGPEAAPSSLLQQSWQGGQGSPHVDAAGRMLNSDEAIAAGFERGDRLEQEAQEGFKMLGRKMANVNLMQADTAKRIAKMKADPFFAPPAAATRHATDGTAIGAKPKAAPGSLLQVGANGDISDVSDVTQAQLDKLKAEDTAAQSEAEADEDKYSDADSTLALLTERPWREGGRFRDLASRLESSPDLRKDD